MKTQALKRNSIKWILPLYFFLSAFQLGRLGDSRKNNLFFSYRHSKIQYEGRIGLMNDAAELYWPGTTLRIKFNGTGVKALLKDEKGQNFYNILVDGILTQKLKLDTARKFYTLAANLSPGEHTLELWDP